MIKSILQKKKKKILLQLKSVKIYNFLLSIYWIETILHYKNVIVVVVTQKLITVNTLNCIIIYILYYK